jgi:hypothetical protein
MFPCPDFVRKLIEYFRRFFAPIDHNHDADYSPTDHDHDDTYYTEGEVDTLLSGKADDPPVNDDRYYTEGEVDTLLAGKSDTGHTHTLSLGKVKQIVTFYMPAGTFTSSGSGLQQVTNLGGLVNITTGKILVILTLPMYQSSTNAPNIASAINVGGVTTKKISQHYSSLAQVCVANIGGHAQFGGISTGYQSVFAYIQPYAGTWVTNDYEDRVPSLTVIEYEN